MDSKFTHRGWMWFIPIYAKLDQDPPLIVGRFWLAQEMIPFVAKLQIFMNNLAYVVTLGYYESPEGYEFYLEEIPINEKPAT